MNERTLSAAPAVPAEAVAPSTQPALAPRPSLSLHIDRVVLEGFAFGARDRGRLQAALQAELTQLLLAQAPGATLLGDVAVPGWQAGELALGGVRDAARLGRAIAQALHARIAS